MFLVQSSAMRQFRRDENGNLIIVSLFLIVAMALCVGVGIDTMRYEIERTKMQNTADRAVLAAAALDRRARNADGSFPEAAYNPEDIVSDYFARSGMGESQIDLTVTPQGGGRMVTVAPQVRVPTLVLQMVGLRELSGPAPSTALETVTDVEIALVLDNSGSMGSGTKLADLKSAAKDFIDQVVNDDAGLGQTIVSVVPFSTQVALSPDIADLYDLSGNHEISSCVNFADADFETAALSPAQNLDRVGHFDIFSFDTEIDNTNVVCPWSSSREILPWSDNKTALKTLIDDMWAGGNTSIDVATKWGLAMLDPSSRPLLSTQITAGNSSAALQGMPFDYARPSTKKYLVVMSDGQNTSQYDLNAEYKSGASPLYAIAVNAAGSYNASTNSFLNKKGRELGFDENGNRPNREELVFSYYDADRNEYFWYSDSTWNAEPEGGDQAVQLDWQDVWDRYSVATFSRDLKQEAIGGSWFTYYNEIYTFVPAAAKNTRTSNICKEAREAGVVVFTIGVGTEGQGDATLLDCASSSTQFYDIESDQMDEAFNSIASQITALRLTF